MQKGVCILVRQLPGDFVCVAWYIINYNESNTVKDCSYTFYCGFCWKVII